MTDCTVDQDNKDAVWRLRSDVIVQAHRLWPEQDRTLNLAYLFPPTGCSVAAVYDGSSVFAVVPACPINAPLPWEPMSPKARSITLELDQVL